MKNGISKINNNDNYYAICSYEGIKKLSEDLNSGKDYSGKSIYLVNDIDCKASFNSETGVLISGEKFEPIGDSNSKIEDETIEDSIKKEFNGNFNGLGFTIKNLYINENQENTYCTGLFGYVGESGIVENIVIKDSYISGYFETGSIVGRNKGTIKNCKNYCSINANKLTGGIAGRNCGIIENCINYGSISTTEVQTGGIAGNCDYGKNVIVRNCENYGDINSTKSYIGGIAGGTFSSYENVIVNINDCKNYGNIGKIENNNANIGGIVGVLQQQTIKNCVNYGEIKGRENVGGITGYTGYDNNKTTLIEKSKNYGTINGTYKCVGGICGFNTGGGILECSNIGEVILNGEETYYGVAGIAGSGGSSNTDTYIEKCYNAGKITLELTNSNSCQIAGIVGNLGMSKSGEHKGYIKDCYNKGEINCIGNEKKQGVTGIVAWARFVVVQNCYNTGKLEGQDANSSGIVYGYDGKIDIENNYWLNTCGATYGIANGNSNIGAESKNDEEFKKLVEKLGDAYAQNDKINDGFPYLVNNKPE